MLIYVFVLLTTPWSPYNYKTLATNKSMIFLISGKARNNFILFEKGEVSGASSKLNHIIKQFCHISGTILFGKGGGQSIKGNKLFTRVKIWQILVSKRA